MEKVDIIKEQALGSFKHDIEFDYDYWTTGKVLIYNLIGRKCLFFHEQ